ncbi:MAG: transglutaminase-like putative cysteine protease [Paraglaciecola sp.]|jgi:transglutaminase-like putative cysteine protease
MKKYLEETYFINFSDASIQQFLEKHLDEENTEMEKVSKLYYAIRDGWWYHPYRLNFEKSTWQASHLMHRKYGHCIDKSNLMIACLRGIGIPARLNLAKVKNHIGVEKIIEKMGTDELVPHAFAEVYLKEKWVKMTPVFNKELCQMLNVEPLEFDGENDSLFQSFDKKGNQFMEYLEYYGSFEDLPLDFIIQKMREHYPEELLSSVMEKPTILNEGN